ncbi:hypothetical protein GOODEAATRI_001532 [Goodea atripinnis]|uniref:long-chain-fatty-acid--CoA ligase n=1 Tax=Goodea atripinnis TaxID=208336 RepID=A0ABV0ME68_9TELE
MASLGGNLRFALTASAPISSTVLSFLRATMGCMICEGYGQTECTGGCTFSLIGDSSTDHVGAPLPCAMVKVVDIPDMNYFSKNGEGENGTLRIIDRKKHIFKLSQGEYVAPEKIENIYLRSAPVLQVFVHGDSLQVKDIYLHAEMFSVANGLLTPTLKSRRSDIRSVFQEQLANMYKTPV